MFIFIWNLKVRTYAYTRFIGRIIGFIEMRKLWVKQININTVGVQHAGDVQVFLGDIERGVQVFERVVLR